MKRFKQILCALCLIISLVPATAFALDETPVDVGTKDAFLAAVADTTISSIRLTADMDLTDAGVLDVSGRTIDLGGNTIFASNFTLILEGTDFTLRNGTFDAKGGSYALFIGDEGTTDNVLVENITANGGINVYNATNVTLRNVDVTGTNYYAVWCDEGGYVTIESGSFQTNGNAVFGLMLTDSALTIKDGTFTTNGKPLVLSAVDGSGNPKWGKPEISGGTFDLPVPEEYCADGFAPAMDENGNYTAVCKHLSTQVKGEKDATIAEAGYTGDRYCVNCGALIEKGASIPALGHSVSDTDSANDESDTSAPSSQESKPVDENRVNPATGSDSSLLFWSVSLLVGSVGAMAICIGRTKFEKTGK
ncbi:MAG: right-handed parallel beta-helix repeat-containing protein [Oscillospiraceae bacterium]